MGNEKYFSANALYYRDEFEMSDGGQTHLTVGQVYDLVRPVTDDEDGSFLILNDKRCPHYFDPEVNRNNTSRDGRFNMHDHFDILYGSEEVLEQA